MCTQVLRWVDEGIWEVKQQGTFYQENDKTFVPHSEKNNKMCMSCTCMYIIIINYVSHVHLYTVIYIYKI